MPPFTTWRMAAASSSLGALFITYRPRARARGPLGKDAFLKGGIHKNEQPGLLRLKRPDKSQIVADAQPQRRSQQLRAAFRDFSLRDRDAVRFAAYHVRLRIKISADPVAKQRLLI
jgi:hypothetical protein